MPFRRFARRIRSRQPVGKHGTNSNRPLRFEPLEDRRLLSITVDTLIDENDGVGIGAGTSLREAIAAAAPGDTINFAVTGTINLTYGATNSTHQLTIDKNLAIQGPGADLLTINAFDPTPTQKNGDGSRAFTIDDGNATSLSNVSISGLTITGGDINTAGGAILAKENLTLSNSVVSGNTTTQVSRTAGGAGIYSSNGSSKPNTLSIVGSTFTGNLATNSEGGAVRKRYGSLLMDGCLITNNSATYAGGVSAADGNIVAQIQNCTITQNKATGPASLIGGGGIVCVGGSLTVSSSTISNNTANQGAGIYAVSLISLTVQNSVISGNVAANAGGGIFVNSGQLINITDSLFNLNSAVNGGGGIDASSTRITVTRTTISNNQGRQGGGIFTEMNTAAVTLNSDTITGNKATIGGGGGIDLVGAATVSDCDISNNSAAGSGGAIVLDLSSSLTLNRTTIRQNTAKNGGGVAAGHRTLTVSSSTLTGNRALNGSGGAIDSIGTISIDQTEISGNSATTQGGGISFVAPNSSSTFSLTNSTVSGNTAAFGGGVSVNGQSSANVTNSTVSGNVASTEAGGIYVGTTATTVRSSTITANNAPDGHGSGIDFLRTTIAGTSLKIGSTIISGNIHSDIDFKGIGSDELHSLGYNLVGAGNETPSFNQPGDQVGILNPQLADLADNGGLTETHALLAGSPALNAGDPAALGGVGTTPLYDQRGKPMSRVAGGRIDIGAYESQPIPAAFMGDFNADGSVDTLDYIVWRHAQGTTGLTPYTGADATGDGVVGPDDYTVWRAHFGATVPTVPSMGSSASFASSQPLAAADQVITPSPAIDHPSAIYPATLTICGPATISKSIKQAENILSSSRDEALSAWLTVAERNHSFVSFADSQDSSDSASNGAGKCADAAFESLAASVSL